MNVRYLAAAGISLAIHTALIWAVPEKKAFAMPVGSRSSQVNIKFVTPSAPSAMYQKAEYQKAEPQKVISQETKPQDKPQITEKASAKPELKPVDAPEPKLVKKTIAKKSLTKKNPVTKKSTVTQSKTAKTAKTAKPIAQPKANKPVKKPVDTKQKVTKTESVAKPAISKSGVTEKPQLISKPSFLQRPSAPRYPRMAQRKGIQGTAIYEIWLSESGQQIKQNLVTSSGTKILDDAALKAIRDWKFSPQIIDGQAIAHRVQIPVRFSLN